MQSRNIVFLRDKIKIEGLQQISDYEYNWLGNKLAVSDSEGNVVVYQKDHQGKFKFAYEFKGSQSAIWKISWAHPKFGDIIGVATFAKRVSVFQLRGTEWQQIAYHTLHQGSVNQVKWAAYYYGLKLYACSSDGNFSVLEVRGNAWHSQLFKGEELSVNTIAVERKSTLDDTDNLQNEYPMIALGGKDKSISIWKHSKSGQYQKIISHAAHNDAVRNILWRKPNTKSEDIEIFSCSQDGTVKLLTFKPKQPARQTILLQQSSPIIRLSQSMTGNVLIASLQDTDQSIVLREGTNGQWVSTDRVPPATRA